MYIFQWSYFKPCITLNFPKSDLMLGYRTYLIARQIVVATNVKVYNNIDYFTIVFLKSKY